MLESLGRIQNPFARSSTAAVTVGSAITMAAAIALDLAQQTLKMTLLIGQHYIRH